MKNLRQVKIKEKAQRCARSKITSEKKCYENGNCLFFRTFDCREQPCSDYHGQPCNQLKKENGKMTVLNFIAGVVCVCILAAGIANVIMGGV